MSLPDPYIGKNDAYLPAHHKSLVSDDELCITVLGLGPDITATYVFQGIFGIIPEHKQWRIPGYAITFFKSSDGRARFYLRDQIVPEGPNRNSLGINYHGNLSITADRRATINHGSHFQEYKSVLGEAADRGFLTNAQLAIELAADILQHDYGHASLAYVLKPEGGPGSKEAYKTAFSAAWRRLYGGPLEYWPYTQFSKDLPLIRELGMTGCQVPDHVMRLLVDSRAYQPIELHMASLLIQSPRAGADAVPGFDRFQRGVHHLIDSITPDMVFVHQYRRSSPKLFGTNLVTDS